MRETRTGSSHPVVGLGQVVVDIATIVGVVFLHHERAALLLGLAQIGSKTLLSLVGQ